MKKRLSLSHPVTFNEKLQWLKLYDRNPKYTMLVDKYKVRKHIEQTIGNKYLIPLIGVWDRAEKIDFDKLPDQFVLKCNHNSGLGMCICRNKTLIDRKAVIKKLNRGLKQNYYLKYREWPYKNVPRRIIAEKYMTDHVGTLSLTDYKFFCFDGIVDCVMIATERHTGNPKFYFFNHKWELLRYNVRGKEAPIGFSLPKPKCIDEMFKIAEILSQDMPFVRVDIYESDERVFFGELTLYPQSGFDNNILSEIDTYWGQLIKLPEGTR